MPTLKIKDTETIGVDPLEEILRLQTAVQESTFFGELPVFEIISEQDQFINEGINKVVTSTVTLKSQGTLTNSTILALTAQIDGLNVLTHKTSIITPDVDNDPNTFNYNAYTSDIFSYYKCTSKAKS